MITLASGANNVYLTLSEKSSSTTASYVILFKDDNTKQVQMVYNTYTTVRENIQKFVITVQSSATWTSGQVDLPKKGFYHYWVYEINDITGIDYTVTVARDPSTLVTTDPTNFLRLVQTGKMKYPASDLSVTSYINKDIQVKAYGD